MQTKDFSVGQAFKFALKGVLDGRFLIKAFALNFLLIAFMATLLALISATARSSYASGPFVLMVIVPLLTVSFLVLLASPLYVYSCLCKMSLDFYDFGSTSVRNAFFAIARRFFEIIGLSFVSWAGVSIGLLFFIVPGYIFFFLTKLAFLVLIDTECGVTDSLRISWSLTRGVRMKLLIFSSVFILPYLIIGSLNLLPAEYRALRIIVIVGSAILILFNFLLSAFVYRNLQNREVQ